MKYENTAAGISCFIYSLPGASAPRRGTGGIQEDPSKKRLSLSRLRGAYANMVRDSRYADNKELLLIPGASHTDLYDGGGKDAIPFDRLAEFFGKHLK